MLGSDVSSHEYFSNLHNNDRFYWSSSFISEIISTSVIAVSSRLSQDYIITVLVSLDGLSDMITRYTKDSNFKVTVSDKRNVYIVHYDKDKVIQRVYDFSADSLDYQETLNYLINKKYFMEMNWKITAYINKSEILKPSFIVAFWIISLTVLIIIYISFYTKDINKKLVKDLDSILASTQSIQKGNYNLTKGNFTY